MTAAKTPRQALGDTSENAARLYLEQQGLRFVQNNFSCRHGEIDLIMRDGDVLVFIEVRFRSNSPFATAAESVTPSKQNKVRNSAAYYLQQEGLTTKQACRFDVYAVDGNKTSWIKGAF